MSVDRLLVIGIGNEFRRDDGVGLHVARQIAMRATPGVVVREESGEGASLMETWNGFERVIVIDATLSGAAPGTIHRLGANEKQIPSEFFHYSTHAFSLAEAVELARALDRLPPSLVVYGIEGGMFAAGRGLSDAVHRAADEVARRVEDDINRAAAIPSAERR